VSIIGLTLPDRGLSGDDAVDLGLACGNGISEINEPNFEFTLPLLESAPPSLVLNDESAPPPPALRSGLVLGLVPRLGLKTSFNRPTGEGERFRGPSVGARSFCEGVPLVNSEVARLSVLLGKVESLETPSKCACNGPASGTVDEFISGEDVVRYPM
jgi:hypothetical protein